MNRLLATLGCDLKLQLRNGFYYAVAVLVAAWALLLTQLPAIAWGPWMPALVLGNLMIGTFMFMGGLILLEKGEGTLEALVVTPLGDSEYLNSKLATLTGLAIVEHVLLVVLAVGLDFSALPFVLGVVLAAAIYCLFGFLAVSRYDSINEYLFPSFFYAAFFSIPFLSYFEIWESRLFYLHPLQAPLVLLKGGFQPLEIWESVYAIGYSVLWIAVLYRLSRRWFHRFIVRREGVQ